MGVKRSSARKFDKGALLRKRNIEFFRRDNELHFNCPFCSDGRERFYLNDQTGYGFCHNCGWASRDLGTFVSDFLGVSRKKAEEMIEASPSRPRAEAVELNEDVVAIDYPPEHRFLKYPPTKLQAPFWRYLESRNIPVSRALDYEIGYARGGRYGMRIFIPVHWEGQLVSWVARDILGTQTPKVLTPENNKEADYLLNLDKLWGASELVLVEGPFDMLRLPDMAVASFGKHLSKQQRALLKKSGTKRVILAWDDDAKDDALEHGRKPRESSLIKVWKELRDWFQVYWVRIPPGEDPASLSEPIMRNLVLEATPFTLADAVRIRQGVTP